jgi:hypothetical protein
MAIFPAHPDEIGEDHDWLEQLLAESEDVPVLSDWEESFLDDIRDRFIQYGARTRISAKQSEILHRIEAKLFNHDEDDPDRDPRDEW